MRLEVVKRYSDKYTHEIIEPGSILEDIPDERAGELINAGIAVEIAQPEENPEDC